MRRFLLSIRTNSANVQGEPIVPRRQLKRRAFGHESRRGRPRDHLFRTRPNGEGRTSRCRDVTAPVDDGHETAGLHGQAGGLQQDHRFLGVQDIEE